MANDYQGQPLYSKHLCSLMRRINALSWASVSYSSQFGSYGSGNGQFDSPFGIATDGSYLYVCDPGNSRIQKFDLAGAYQSQFGSGEFFGIACSGSYLYATDISGLRVQKFSPDGTLVTSWGSYGYGDGQFVQPYGVCVLGEHVYVADLSSNRIQKFSEDGTFIAKWEQSAPHGLTATSGSVAAVVGAIGTIDRIFVFSQSGILEATLMPYGTGDGQSVRAYDLTFNRGLFLVSDDAGSQVQALDLAGEFLYKFGSAGSGNGQFDSSYGPRGIVCVDNAIFVVDCGNHRVQKFLTATPATEFYGHNVADKVSIGAWPVDNALSMYPFVSMNLIQLRIAIINVLTAGYYKNPATGNTFNMTNGSPDNLIYVAMGDRTKYGATGGAKYTWTRSEAAMEGTPLYDIDIGEIEECVTTLENADT